MLLQNPIVSALLGFFGQIGAWYQQIVAWAQSGEFLLTTGSAVSYQQQDVIRLWHINVVIADGLLAVVVAWIGYSTIIGVYEPLNRLSRVVLAAVGSHASLFFAGLLIELNNGMARAVLPTFTFADLASHLLQVPVAGGDPGAGFQVALVQIFAGMVTGEMFVRLALLNVLLTLLPYAFLLYVLLETQAIASLILGTFVAVLFLQFATDTVLELGIRTVSSLGGFSIVNTVAAVSTLTLVGLIPRWLGSAVTGSIQNNIRSDQRR